jgi:hypothetical protein
MLRLSPSGLVIEAASKPRLMNGVGLSRRLPVLRGHTDQTTGGNSLTLRTWLEDQHQFPTVSRRVQLCVRCLPA